MKMKGVQFDRKICRYCGHINKQINNRCAKCHESLEQESKGFSLKIIRQACSEMASSSVSDDVDGALHVPTTSIKTENDASSGPSTSSNVTMTTDDLNDSNVPPDKKKIINKKFVRCKDGGDLMAGITYNVLGPNGMEQKMLFDGDNFVGPPCSENSSLSLLPNIAKNARGIKEWHQKLTQTERNLQINKLSRNIISKQHISTANLRSSTENFAKKLENNIYKSANSKEDYFKLLKEILDKVNSELTMKTQQNKKIHSATNDIEMMDFKYKVKQENEVSDDDNTGVKGNNTHLKSQTSENVEKSKKRKFVESTDDEVTTKKKKTIDLTTRDDTMPKSIGPSDNMSEWSDILGAKRAENIKQIQTLFRTAKREMEKQKLIEERDKNICKIMDLGYSSEEASQALKLTKGNLALAADYLINKKGEATNMDDHQKDQGGGLLNDIRIAQYPWLSSQSTSRSTTRRPPSTFLPTRTPKMSVHSPVITASSPETSSGSNVAFKYVLAQCTSSPKTTFSKNTATPSVYYSKIFAQNSGFHSSMLTPLKGESKATRKSSFVTSKSTFATGKSTSPSVKPTFVTSKSTFATGKSTSPSVKPTFVTGKSTFATGKSTSPSVKPTFVTGKSSFATSKSTYVTDKSTPATSKPTPLTGKSTPVTGKTTFVTGKSASPSINSTFVTGKSTPATSKSTFVTGKSTFATSKSTYVTDKSTPATSKSTFVTGKSTFATSKSTPVTGTSTSKSVKFAADIRTDRSSSKSPTFLTSTESSAMASPSLASAIDITDSVQDENKAYDSYNKMEEEMTCPVCLELYTDPIMLPCSHSLCKQCVKDIKLSTVRNREEGINCPSCRKHMKLSWNRIANLPQNLALKNTVFHFQQVSQHHQQLVLQKSMAEKPKLTLCKDHHDEHVTMFCNQCKVLICHLCLCEGQGKHIGHKVVTKDAAADKIKENAESDKKSLEPLLDAVQERSQKIEQQCNDIEDVYTKACEQVEKKYVEMLKNLQEKKEGFLQTLTLEKTKAVSNLQKHLRQNGTTLKQVEISMTTYQNVLEERNVEELLSNANETSLVTDKMMVIKDSLHESRGEFVELIESRRIQENLNEAVDKFRTALDHCVLPLAKSEFMVTQSITSPVTSISQSGQHMMEGQHNHIPPPNCVPMPHMIPQMEGQQQPQTPAEKKKKEGSTSHSTAPSPGGASTSSYLEEFENINSPAGSSWTSSKSVYGDIQKMYEMGTEPDRRLFLDQLFMFLDDKNTPLMSMPSIGKQPLDLYKLYQNVRDRGGMLEVTKSKKWKEICGNINIGCSVSAAFTLKKNYIQYLFAYECQFDRDGMDPQSILAQIEDQLKQEREQKNGGRAPSPDMLHESTSTDNVQINTISPATVNLSDSVEIDITPPTDEELKEVAKEILRKTKDVASQITIRKLLQQVYDKYPGLDLTDRKQLIKATALKFIKD